MKYYFRFNGGIVIEQESDVSKENAYKEALRKFKELEIIDVEVKPEPKPDIDDFGWNGTEYEYYSNGWLNKPEGEILYIEAMYKWIHQNN